MAKGRRATKSRATKSRATKSRRKSRRGRKATRRGKRMTLHRFLRGKWMGGAHTITPAPLNDTGMAGASKLNLAQGGDYASLHQGQHGGAISFANSAPPGYTGMLDSSLIAAARTGPTMQSLNAASGMSDQGGGGRRRRRGSRRGSRRSRRSRSRQRGGAAMTPFSIAAAADSPGMLLSPGMEQKAMMGMHTAEWNLAKDPTSFAPKM